jgi:hypothetical protein
MTERTAQEWGRVAVSLPGWRWMPGMLDQKNRRYHVTVPHELCNAVWPDPDDPATEGCMVRLLGPVHEAVWYTGDCDRWVVAVGEERRLFTTLGRACIAAAEAFGRWPNVAECGRMEAE